MSERDFLCEVRVTTIHRGIIRATSQGVASAMAGARLDSMHDVGMHVETTATDVAKARTADAELLDATARVDQNNARPPIEVVELAVEPTVEKPRRERKLSNPVATDEALKGRKTAEVES